MNSNLSSYLDEANASLASGYDALAVAEANLAGYESQLTGGTRSTTKLVVVVAGVALSLFLLKRYV